MIKPNRRKGAVLLITTVALGMCSFVCSILVGFIIRAYTASNNAIKIQLEKIELNNMGESLFNYYLNGSGSIDVTFTLDSNLDGTDENYIFTVKSDTSKEGYFKYYTIADTSPDKLQTKHYVLNLKIYSTSENTSSNNHLGEPDVYPEFEIVYL